SPTDRAPDVANDLLIPVNAGDFDTNPRLLARLRASPHGYFRFINLRFAQRVCGVFHDRLGELPPVNLHGDTHLEQYAVTEFGRGLTDFDDSTSGPAVIDLLRFATSIQLACGQRNWHADAPAVLRQFLAGYRATLADPDTSVEAPAWAEETRRGFVAD